MSSQISLRAAACVVIIGIVALLLGWSLQKFAVANVVPERAAADPVTPVPGAGRTSPVSATDRAACRRLMAAFGDYPVVWLGEEFEGLPLVGCERVTTAATNYGVPATDYFFVYYGECLPLEGVEHGSCAVPLQLSIEPACSAPIVEQARKNHLEIRGASAAELHSGAVQIETGQLKVMISTGNGEQGKDQALRAAERIEGGNPLTSRLTAQAALNDAAAVRRGTKVTC